MQLMVGGNVKFQSWKQLSHSKRINYPSYLHYLHFHHRNCHCHFQCVHLPFPRFEMILKINY